MKFLCILVLFYAAVQAANVPRTDSRNLNHGIPMKPIFPKYTAEKWKEVLKKANERLPENVPNFKKGTERQDERAGKVTAKVPAITYGNTAYDGQFPWQVQMIMDGSSFCGGSIISQNWILSAGHCSYQYSNWVITSGSIYLDYGNQQQTGYSILHQAYDPYRLDNDISLMYLNQPLYFDQNTSPISLPSGFINTDGQIMTVSGYGKTSDNSGLAQVLQWTQLQGIDSNQCAYYFGDMITGSKFCVATPGGTSVCNGDSGGPMILPGGDRYVEVGIVSFGNPQSCTAGTPAVFTRVTSFIQWIESNTGLLLSE